MGDTIMTRAIEELKENIDSVEKVVLYHGGEPLLNRRFYQLVGSIKSIKPELYVKTVTNGMALNEENSLSLIKSGIDLVEVSLDGLSSNESESIRRGSDSGKIINNIRRLLNTRGKLGLSRPQINVSTTQFIRDKSRAFPLPPAETPLWLLEEFKQSVNFKATYALKWPHMTMNDYDYLLSPLNEEKNECDHVINTITIRSDGNVVPCCYDLTSKLIMGNIKTNSLRSIWNGENYRKLRDSISSREFYSICAACAVVKSPVYLIPKRGNEAQPLFYLDKSPLV